MQVTVRPAIEADTIAIADFNCQLAHESERKQLDRSLVLAGVAACVADPHKGRYFLAEAAGEIVGQLMITYEWSDWRNGWFWWIQSVYVVPAVRRQGVFRQLFNHLLSLAKVTPGVIGVRLYVEKENQRAQQTYQEMGLEWSGYAVMEQYPLR